MTQREDQRDDEAITAEVRNCIDMTMFRGMTSDPRQIRGTAVLDKIKSKLLTLETLLVNFIIGLGCNTSVSQNES